MSSMSILAPPNASKKTKSVESKEGRPSLLPPPRKSVDHLYSPQPLNQNLKELKIDFLYHLGLDTSMDLEEMFGDVKYVCMGGSNERMRAFAEKVKTVLGFSKLFPIGSTLIPIGKAERYHLYKVGPVICVSHGMGMPSIMILLHELAKLMYYAKATDYVFIRIGTSGGLGVPPGTVVLTTEALNSSLEPTHTTNTFGKTVVTPTILSKELNELIIQSKGDHEVVLGKTLCTDDFYEEQGRMDGFFCEFTSEDRSNFLAHLRDNGVCNIEMESEAFSSFCYRAKIPAAVACSVLVNRFNGDQVSVPPEEIARISENSINVVLSYIKSRLSANLNPMN